VALTLWTCLGRPLVPRNSKCSLALSLIDQRLSVSHTALPSASYVGDNAIGVRRDYMEIANPLKDGLSNCHYLSFC